MSNRLTPRPDAGRFLLLLTLLVGVAGGAAAAAPPAPPRSTVDVQVIVASSGKGPDQVAVTYAGTVTEEQARQDLQALSAALGTSGTNVRVTTKRIAASAPAMTSAEADYPEIVNRQAGALPVQPFVDTYRRFSRLRLSYFVEPPFKLVSPAKPVDTGDVQIAVDNQGLLINYDVTIRHAEDGDAGNPALGRASPWARLLGPGLFLLLLIAAAVGVAVFLLLRRSGAERLSRG